MMVVMLIVGAGKGIGIASMPRSGSLCRPLTPQLDDHLFAVDPRRSDSSPASGAKLRTGIGCDVIETRSLFRAGNCSRGNPR